MCIRDSTTTAVTIFNAGTKENVLPPEARAVVNFRLMPGETIEAVIERSKGLINDERVSVEILGPCNEAAPVAAIDAPAYEVIARTILHVYPEVITAPGMTLGGTDSRHYGDVADGVYRFSPLWLTPEDLPRIHGANERISVAEYIRAIQFFGKLIRNAAG